MSASAARKIQNIKPLSLFQKIADKDRLAVKDCVDSYENFVRALARKFTGSMEEAEAAAREIFIDIRRYVERAEQPQSDENLLIALIARRRLIKYLR